MRASFLLMALILLNLTCAAQEKAEAKVAAAAPSITRSPASDQGRVFSRPLDLFHVKRDEYSVGKTFRLHGPLVFLSRPSTIREVPARLFQLINPFPKQQETFAEPTRYPESRAREWNNVVGWHPTLPALRDPITHEGGIVLISIGR